MIPLETLSEQGEYSAIENMRRAIKDIDETFGKGYAKEHPDLLGSIVMASSIDYAGTLVSDRLSELVLAISTLNEE